MKPSPSPLFCTVVLCVMSKGGAGSSQYDSLYRYKIFLQLLPYVLFTFEFHSKYLLLLHNKCKCAHV